MTHSIDVKKKILLLGPSFSAVSGVSTHLSQLFGSSLSEQFDLIHFQVGSEGRKEGVFEKLIRFLFSPFALVLKIISEKPDIIHLNTSLEPKSFWRDAVYLAVSLFLVKKVVYQVHGGELPQQFFNGNRFLTSFLRWFLTLPDAVVLLASVELEAYQSFTHCKRLLVIPNAVDLKDFPELPEKNTGSGMWQLGYIGRLAHNKGVFEAIEALDILRKAGVEDTTLTIAGSGPAEADLRGLVKKLGLETDVVFAGPLFGEQKQRFWAQVDIFVFPTFHREGLPYTVLESLASGTPIVTTRVGGIRDVITDGVQGIFVAPHDAKGVAAALHAMIHDKQRIDMMSAACAARAKEFYGIDRLAGQFSQLYTSLLS